MAEAESQSGDPDVERLLERAREARSRAYAPYSGYAVGAALESVDGSIHVGCNVENASYGLSICAERAAVAAAVVAGDRSFRRLVLSTAGPETAPPCGACRQVLSEFGLDLEIVSVAGERRERWTLRTLLPEPFVLKSDLENDASRKAASEAIYETDHGNST